MKKDLEETALHICGKKDGRPCGEKSGKPDLEEALLAYGKSDYYPFHMPGHKRRRLGDWIPEEIDITEIDGFDNLHHAAGLLREAQERLAEVFGAAESFYLVNGSTAGILAAVCASVSRGGRILMGRNCHKSVYHAAYLMELQPEYLWPQETEFGIQGSITPAEVEEKLRRYPDAEAVILTSPTYDGVASDIAAIARAVHARGIPLIVDAAHGAHFGFGGLFPPRALAAGADLSVESLHKTLPAYTQTAALHVAAGARADREKLRRYLGIFQTSSPSYVLMAGMERCVRMLKQDGGRMFAEFEQRLGDFYKACERLRRVEVFPLESKEAGIWRKDPSKILISAERAGYHGQQLYELLLKKYRLQMEMASGHYVTALTSVMDTQEGFDRLARALSEIDQEGIPRPAGPGAPRGVLTSEKLYRPLKRRLEMHEAMDAPWRETALLAAEGETSAEFLYLYPPGIPLAVPGEVLDHELLRAAAACRERGMQLEGMADLAGEKIRTVRT